MRRLALATLGLVLVTSLAAAPSGLAASTSDTETEVTFRAAPAGMVVPSLILVDNPSVWVIDPAEDKRFNDQPGIAGCQLNVTDANGNGAVDGVDALNEADETGCITNWNGRNDNSCTDGSDVFVAEVDGLEEVYPATFWLVQKNGTLADNGVCDMSLADGDDIGFVYQ